jgi:hypothetical protein
MTKHFSENTEKTFVKKCQCQINNIYIYTSVSPLISPREINIFKRGFFTILSMEILIKWQKFNFFLKKIQKFKKKIYAFKNFQFLR